MNLIESSINWICIIDLIEIFFNFPSIRWFSFKWNIIRFEITIDSSLSFIFYETCWKNILNRNRICASIRFASSERTIIPSKRIPQHYHLIKFITFLLERFEMKKDEKTSFFTTKLRMQNIKFWYFLNLFNFPFIVCFIEKMDNFDSIEKHIFQNGQPLRGLFQLLFPGSFDKKCFL